MGQLVNCLGEGGPNILILEPKEIFYANTYTRGHDPPQPLGSFVPMSKCLKGLTFILTSQGFDEFDKFVEAIGINV